MNITDLQNIKLYGRAVWAQSLRSLFPRGIIWDWYLQPESNINAVGIPSAESLGIATITGAPFVYPAGIPSDSVVDVFTKVNFILNGEGIVSEEFISEDHSITSDFFHLTDEFTDGEYNPWWDSAFRTNWDLQVNDDLEYVAVRGMDAWDRLTPTGVGIVGDFEMFFTVYALSTCQSNYSVHVRVKKYSDNSFVCDTYYAPANYSFEWSAGQTAYHGTPSLPAYLQMKIKRVSGVITAYAFVSGAWLPCTSWTVPHAGPTYSGEVWLEANGAQLNGFTRLELIADAVVTH